MKLNVISGAVFAAVALSLSVGSTSVTTPASAAEKVVCCSVDTYKGQAACEGQGWINASAAYCEKWGGKIL
jgi:hypothetical protein